MCLTVVWQSRDHRPLSRDPSVTFYKKFPNCLKRPKTVSRRSRDLRPLSCDRSATFFKKISNCLKHPKTLFDSRPTVAWPQPLSRDRSATFFKNSSNCLIPRKTVVWQSADGRVSSDLVGTSEKCLLKVSGLSRDGPVLLFLWLFRTASNTASQIYISFLFLFLLCRANSFDGIYELARANFRQKWKILKFLMLATTISQKR